MKKHFIFVLTLFVSASLFSKEDKKDFSLEDVWVNGKFRENFVWGIRPLKNEEHYAKTQMDEKTKMENILIYDFKTGKTVDTLFKGEWLKPEGKEKAMEFDSYELSEDETKILFSTETEHIYRHSTVENYYVWDRKDKTLKLLSDKGKQRLATFSPDGSKVAFVRDNNIFIRDLTLNPSPKEGDLAPLTSPLSSRRGDGGEVQITFDGKRNEIINGATDWVYEEEFSFTQAYFWSPDGNKIAYYRFDESAVKEFSFPMYDNNYAEPYKFKYPKAGEENSTVSIHVYDLGTKNISTADMGTYDTILKTDPISLDTLFYIVKTEMEYEYIPRIKWTKDSNVLSIQRMNRWQNKLELLLADAKSGKAKTILTEENKYYIDISDNLTFLKDKKHFLWSSDKDGYNHLYLYSMESGMVQQITKGNWDVTNFYGIDEKTNTIYYQSAEISPMERQVYSIHLDGTGKKKITPKAGTNSATFTQGFTYYIGYHSTANTPNEAEIFSIDGKAVRVLENNQFLRDTLNNYKISTKEFFSFKTSEGVQLNGYMLKPYDFKKNKKYPVFMYVYGGPGSQTVNNSWDGRNLLWFQYLANLGYIVVSVDNRGTGARGEEFKKMTYLHLLKYEVADQIEAAKYLGSLDFVDKERIGIFGWSYGGHMTSMCILLGADMFKMAIAVAPVTDWKFYDSIYTERYMRTPKENPNGYKESSPLNYADRLKGKFLLIHGTADDNVHFQNSAELISALQKANKQFDLMIYPNKNHGISGGVTRMNLYTKMTGYILGNL